MTKKQFEINLNILKKQVYKTDNEEIKDHLILNFLMPNELSIQKNPIYVFLTTYQSDDLDFWTNFYSDISNTSICKNYKLQKQAIFKKLGIKNL